MEASMDLGADAFQTFWLVLPTMRSALLAGAILAFSLSFDEIIVTTFTAGTGRPDPADLDLHQPHPPQPAPIVNVVAVLLVLISSSPSGSPSACRKA